MCDARCHNYYELSNVNEVYDININSILAVIYLTKLQNLINRPVYLIKIVLLYYKYLKNSILIGCYLRK
jgi:hypothetical protein